MVDIPSFFTRTDFWVTLLPGYIAILLGLFLLSHEQFNFMLMTEESLVNFFSAIVFIVAGPAIGLIIWQFFLNGIVLIWYIIGERDKKYEFFREYSRLRLLCEDKERAELDAVDAQYQFGISTGIAILVIAILYSLFYIAALSGYSSNAILGIYHFESTNCNYNNISSIQGENSATITSKQKLVELKCDLQQSPNIVLVIFLFLVPSLLTIGSKFYNRGVRLPIICKLMRNYHSLQSTKICREIRATRPQAIISFNNEIIDTNYIQIIRPGQTVMLDGSNSYSGQTVTLDDNNNNNHESLFFEWKKIDGPKVIPKEEESLESACFKFKKSTERKTLTFTVPTLIKGTYLTFELIVYYKKEMSKPPIVKFKVMPEDKNTTCTETIIHT